MTRRLRIPFFITLLFALLVAGGGGWSALVGRRQAAEIAELQRQTAQQRADLQRLRAPREAAQRMPLPDAPPPPVAALDFATGDAAFDRRMRTTLARLAQFQAWLQAHPEECIPEFQLVRDTAWIEAATGEHKMDFANTVLQRRVEGRANLAALLSPAVKSYAEAHEGRLPTDLAQLAPFSVFPIPAAILQRYELRATGLLAAVPRDLPFIGERADAIAASRTADSPFVFRPLGAGREGFPESPFLASLRASPAQAVAISKANQAYRNAHDGAHPRDLAVLAPYFEDPALAAALLENRPAPASPTRPVN